MMDFNEKEHNTLTAIKGIGPSRQQWLRESFGARTFRDLAALSVAEIETRLKTEGQITSRREIERWIAQAKELAAADKSRLRIEDSTTTKVGEKANSPAVEGEWKPFASFVVEFQVCEVESRAKEHRTSVHHMEVDQGQVWSGIESEQLCQWMRDQVNKEMQRMPTIEPAVEKALTEPLSVMVDIAQIRLFQPPQADTPKGIGKPGQAFTGFVKGGEPFALEVSFELAGPGAVDIAKASTTYSAQFHARNLTLGSNIPLGDANGAALTAGKASHSAALREASLPPGVYHLWVFVTLHSTPPKVGFLEVPLLRVA